MRALVRLVVLVAVLLSSVALSPVASADDTTGTGTTDPTTGQTTGPTGDPTMGQTTGPATDATIPPPTDPGTGSGADPGTDPGTGQGDPPTPPPSTDPTPPPALPVTTIDRAPANPTQVPAGSVVPSVFAFHADLPGATFQCRIIGAGGKHGIWEGCPGGVAGQATYPVLVGGSYTFQVRATLDGGLTFGNPTPELTWQVLDCTTTMTLCKVYAPDRYAPPAGASFNNPTGDSPAQRRNLTHVIRTINSMPGYAVKSAPCATRAMFPRRSGSRCTR